MAFGIPASYSETRRFKRRRDELRSAIEAAFESLGWRYSAVSFHTYRAEISIGLFSWGENVVVEMFPNDEIQVKSQCAFQPQIIDWGKNRRNVKQFFRRLEETENLCAETIANQRNPPAFDEKGFSPIERIFNESNKS